MYHNFGNIFIEIVDFCLLLKVESLFLSLEIVISSAKSADPDEMPHYSGYHLGLHCLSKNLFTSIQNEKGYK